MLSNVEEPPNSDELPGGWDQLDAVPLERVEEELILWAGHIAAATARWLRWLAVYDRRAGWESWGCRSAAHWLSWKCSMSLGTARNHVRVARALEELPVVAEAFSAGELSFSKVRALSRLAQPFDEVEMVETARWATASQLDRLVAGCRQAMDDQPEAVAPAAIERFRTRGRSDGLIEITVIVSEVDAERIDNAIAAVSDRLVVDRESGVSVTDRVEHLGGWAEIRAQAATDLLTNSIDLPGPDPTQLVVEVESVPNTEGTGDVLVGQCATSGRCLPDQVIRRLGCDAVIATLGTNAHQAEGHEGESGAGVGLTQRVVPHWLRRQLERRDHHSCQFPGCASTRRLHAHHIIHWLDHGPTNLDNLLLLCSFHHHLMHEGGWHIEGPAGSPRFIRPDGGIASVLPLSGDAERISAIRPPAKHGADGAEDPEDSGDGQGGKHAESGSSLASLWDGQPLDLHFAVAVMATNLGVQRDGPLSSN